MKEPKAFGLKDYSKEDFKVGNYLEINAEIHI